MEYKLKGGMPGMPQVPPAMPMILLILGIGMIGFGVLLFVNEWLLRYIVASVFVLLGALLTVAGARAKKLVG